MNTAWTPGPWGAKESRHDGEFSVFAPDETEICEIWKTSAEDDRAQHNAHLIAAAPEMYEALAKMTARYVALAGSGDCGFWNPEEEPDVIASRAALRRAEGNLK